MFLDCNSSHIRHYTSFEIKPARRIRLNRLTLRIFLHCFKGLWSRQAIKHCKRIEIRGRGLLMQVASVGKDSSKEHETRLHSFWHSNLKLRLLCSQKYLYRVYLGCATAWPLSFIANHEQNFAFIAPFVYPCLSFWNQLRSEVSCTACQGDGAKHVIGCSFRSSSKSGAMYLWVPPGPCPSGHPRLSSSVHPSRLY